MAVTPVEAARIASTMTKGDLIRVAVLEREIDDRLTDPRNHSVTNFFVDIVGDTGPRVQNELTRRYEAAGWVVTWHDDQRDGLSIQLQPKIPEPIQTVYGEKY
jgi:hypothetical protein